jgi:phosphoribosylglycinamide formyltransferase 2
VVLCRYPIGLTFWQGVFAMTEPTDRPTVLLLVTADSGRDLALAFTRLGAAVIIVGEDTDADTLTARIDSEKARYVVADSPEVAVDTLIAAAGHASVEVFPTPRAVRLSTDREGLRRLAADELGLPTVPFWFAGSVEELGAVADHAGFPLLVTPVAVPAIDGKIAGQSVMKRVEDIEAAWELAGEAGGTPHRVMAETVVDIDDEVTLLTIRNIGQSGPTVHFSEPIGHHRATGGTLETWQPHELSPAALDAARSVAARIVNSLGGRGVFAVELLVRGDEVYFSTVRPRPDEAGLVTLRSQRLTQFELHARGILGLTTDTIMISPAAAEISDGTSMRIVPGAQPLAEALAVAESDVRFIGDTFVALATAPDVVRARDRAHQVSTALHKSGS